MLDPNSRPGVDIYLNWSGRRIIGDSAGEWGMAPALGELLTRCKSASEPGMTKRGGV